MGVYIRVDEPRQPGANTVLYLPLTSDTLFTDQSVNQNDFTNVGGVTFGINQGVDCAYFSGQSGAYATISSFVVGSDTNYTISYWEYILGGSYDGNTFADASNKGFGKSWKTGISPSNGNLAFEWTGGSADGGSGEWYLNEDVVFTPDFRGGWHNATFTFEVLGPSEAKLKFYADGQLCKTATSCMWLLMSTRTGQHTIGSDPYYSVGGRLMNGYLSKLLMERVTWTAEEIADYYNQTKSLYGIS